MNIFKLKKNNLLSLLIFIGVLLTLVINLMRTWNLNEAKNDTNELNADAKDLLNPNPCNYSKNGPRILCGIYTYPKNHNKSALAMFNTWGKR